MAIPPFDKLEGTPPFHRLLTNGPYGIIMSGKSRRVKIKIGIFRPLTRTVKIGDYGRKIKPVPRFSGEAALDCDSMGPS